MAASEAFQIARDSKDRRRNRPKETGQGPRDELAGGRLAKQKEAAHLAVAAPYNAMNDGVTRSAILQRTSHAKRLFIPG
jgi:hypothetical protein